MITGRFQHSTTASKRSFAVTFSVVVVCLWCSFHVLFMFISCPYHVQCIFLSCLRLVSILSFIPCLSGSCFSFHVISWKITGFHFNFTCLFISMFCCPMCSFSSSIFKVLFFTALSPFGFLLTSISHFPLNFKRRWFPLAFAGSCSSFVYMFAMRVFYIYVHVTMLVRT